MDEEVDPPLFCREFTPLFDIEFDRDDTHGRDLGDMFRCHLIGDLGNLGIVSDDEDIVILLLLHRQYLHQCAGSRQVELFEVVSGSLESQSVCQLRGSLLRSESTTCQQQIGSGSLKPEVGTDRVDIANTFRGQAALEIAGIRLAPVRFRMFDEVECFDLNSFL